MYKTENLKILENKPRKTVYRYAVGSDKWLLINFKKGFVGGKHYHKGISRAKNPETLILIKGKLKLTLLNLKTNQKSKAIIKSPKIIKIKPYVYHEALALEESFFLELNDSSKPEDKFILKNKIKKV